MKTLKLTLASNITVTALLLAVACTFFFSAGSAHATPYGTEITKYDGIGTYVPGTANEDNEAEPGMVQSQAWDLEGFFLNGKSLTIAGGYNFYMGEKDGSKTMKAGDIFIDTNGDAVYSPNTIPGFDYSPGYKEVSNGLFKYDYVLDIDWAGGTFDIVQLNNTSILKDSEYGAQYNKPSNPWIFMSGGTVMNGSNPLTFNTYDKASQDNTGFSGWGGNNNHYVATFDISAITFGSGPSGTVFHNTMECGNDNLIGQAAPVPEPGTMALLGFGMLGLAIYGKRRMNKEA